MKELSIEEKAKTYDGSSIFENDNIEQKSNDKVEPKFKVGYWVVGANNVYKIISLNDELNCYMAVTPNNEEVKIPYYFDDEQGHICSYHLWTIQDAKNGDVLVSGQLIIIFKEFEEETDWNFVIAYAGIDISGKLQITNEHWLINNNTKPASKEQRDLLFLKMREAGYKWDAEKKELKKIEQLPIDVRTTGYWHVEDVEQNPINEPKFNIAIDESLVDEQVTTFCNITKDMCELYAKKNHDYGNSFDECCDKIGTGYPLGRLLDKINRLIACMGKEDKMQVNESIEDTLTDLACYSVMTLSYLRRKK